MDDMNVTVTVSSNSKVSVSDCDDLESKYKKAIQKMVDAKIMLNTKEDNFSPESYCTYEQAYYSLVALYDLLVDEE
ncbi:S-layer homology domain-containing protein [Anaerocolumna aminovalerica]|uniref:S-layer homology domain-containing protein n=1 Tax=Anaerocolumna aminovalerica TaxID=1527 RepID=UPI001C0EEC7E|nr:S-layer homology domain-containing protein [Anaerocolumna aminovalerica]MBU5334295.1 S-layer homology domain-containing protein [Anaerocolumna aminovalerica]